MGVEPLFAAENFVFQAGKCQFFERKDGQWKPGPPPLSPGEQVIGERVTKASVAWVHFKQAEQRWIAKQSCFSRVQSAASWSWVLGAMAWSEGFSGESNFVGNVALNSRQRAARLGLEWSKAVGSRFEVGFEGSFLLGAGSASSSSGSAYSAGTAVGGVLVVPSLSLRTEQRTWGVGVVAPVILRNAAWPESGSGLALPPALGLRTGLGLRLSRRGKALNFGLEAGAMSNLSHWMFSVTLGKSFGGP